MQTLNSLCNTESFHLISNNQVLPRRWVLRAKGRVMSTVHDADNARQVMRVDNDTLVMRVA